ncbi:hypothetical protein B0T14DRAFT_517892 [Immersiella caudata]|uniref:C2H2-type domain-containing protein n=1 Tax=Immersiella caudata TaxID=314043 RepID=A0AA40C432_9PEZI|nr:hypothetical protein B0T14DRAFT_517892 [Immersiella caudata]
MIPAITNQRGRRAQITQTRRCQHRRAGIPSGRQKPHRQPNDHRTSDLVPLAPKLEGMNAHKQEQIGVHARTDRHIDYRTLELATSKAAVKSELLQNDIKGECIAQNPLILPQQARKPELKRPQDQPEDQEERPFVCPYYKWDPEQHKPCRGYILSRFRDVLQHMRRRHVVDLYCTRCYMVFDTLLSLEAHEHDFRICPERHRAGIVSRYHLDRFFETKEHSSRRGTSAEAQWRELWDFLFPGCEGPPSVYVETPEEEMASDLALFWDRNRYDIANQVIEHGQLTAGSLPDSLVQVLDLFLRQLLAQFKDAGPSERRKSPSSITSDTTLQPSDFSDLEQPMTDDPTSASSDFVMDGRTPTVTSQDDWLLDDIDAFYPFDYTLDGVGQESLPLYQAIPWPDCPPLGTPWPLVPLPQDDNQGTRFDDTLPATEHPKSPDIIDLTGSD